jgi:hypothetical protein
VLPEFSLLPLREYRVISPDGGDRAVNSDDNGVVSGIGAESTGQYEVREGRRLVKRLGASLLSPLESTLHSEERLQFRELPVTAAEADIKSDYPLWRWCALFAFCVAIGEWWCFQRRPGGLSQ